MVYDLFQHVYISYSDIVGKYAVPIKFSPSVKLMEIPYSVFAELKSMLC